MPRRPPPKRFDKSKHPLPGLYRKGAQWWLRVKAPSGRQALRPTGAKWTPVDEVAIANAIVDLLDRYRAKREHWHRIEAVIDGTTTLKALYRASEDDTQVEALIAATERADLEPSVAKWAAWQKQHDKNVAADTVDDYVRHVRGLIPAGAPFYAEQLTRDAALAYVSAPARQKDPSASTRRNRLFALTKFVKWLRAEGVDVGNAPEQLAQISALLPTPAPRRVAWQEFGTVEKVLGLVASEEYRAALALLFGTGMELSALRAVKPVDIVAASRAVRARGTKNDGRDRVVFVRSWAWAKLAAWVEGKPATELLFPGVGKYGDGLRDALYAAQLAAGIAKPGDDLHNLHDARHTYCCLASLGRDGDPRLTERQLADQLGHSTTQMVQQIYNLFKLAEQVRALEEAERIEAAVATALAGKGTGSANGSKDGAQSRMNPHVPAHLTLVRAG